MCNGIFFSFGFFMSQCTVVILTAVDKGQIDDNHCKVVDRRCLETLVACKLLISEETSDVR